jgi:hypothetical protein
MFNIYKDIDLKNYEDLKVETLNQINITIIIITNIIAFLIGTII